MFSRRSFLTGATAIIITAPAIVRVASIMPVKSYNLTIAKDGMSWNFEVDLLAFLPSMFGEEV